MILWVFKHVQMSDGGVVLQETINLEFNWELSGIRTQRGAVIFQNFINEHNLWGTTAVLALSVHATVENNNLEFLLFCLTFFPPPRPHFVSHLFDFFFVVFFPSLLFPGTQRQLEVKVLDFCYSTDNSINKPHRLPPLLAAPTICTQINYNVQTKKNKTPKKQCYIVTS